MKAIITKDYIGQDMSTTGDVFIPRGTIVHNIDYVDNPDLTITLHSPPYDDETILSRTKWKLKDVTITELKRGVVE